MNTSERCDMAIAILSATEDGRKLYQSEENVERYGRNGDGWQLALVQFACNGDLNEPGERLFDARHRPMLTGD